MQGSALSRLVPVLGQGRAADSPFLPPLSGFPETLVWLQGQWGEATGSQQRVRDGEAPLEPGRGVSSCWDRLKPGQTLGGAEELEIFPPPSLAWVLVGFGHPGAFLNGKPLAVVPQPLHLEIPGERRDPLPMLGSQRNERGASHPAWRQRGVAADISCG